MSESEDYRNPLFIDVFGLYITAQQMQHYLMRPEGEENFEKGTLDFFKYFNYCRVYNLLYDISEDSPDDAQMYWDHELETVAFRYPKKGKVDKHLVKLRKKNAFFGNGLGAKDNKLFFRNDASGLEEEDDEELS